MLVLMVVMIDDFDGGEQVTFVSASASCDLRRESQHNPNFKNASAVFRKRSQRSLTAADGICGGVSIGSVGNDVPWSLLR